MLRALKEVRADDSVVGFYQSTTMGAFFSQNLVDTQAIHQEKLRHGGVVVVHGTVSLLLVRGREPTTFASALDVSQSNRGNASFRAFRLSKEFLEAYRKTRFSAKS
jgi:translation initiation factor 3 subunit H